MGWTKNAESAEIHVWRIFGEIYDYLLEFWEHGALDCLGWVVINHQFLWEVVYHHLTLTEPVDDEKLLYDHVLHSFYIGCTPVYLDIDITIVVLINNNGFAFL